MTISLKADASGNSGAIQVSGNDKLIVNADGSLVAAVNPATGVRSNTLATMQKFADEFGASLATSGYQKLPSGLIIQWSEVTTPSNSDVAVTFPVAFTSSARQVMATANLVTAGAFVGVSGLTATGFRVSGWASNSTRASLLVRWLAIGN